MCLLTARFMVSYEGHSHRIETKSSVYLKVDSQLYVYSEIFKMNILSKLYVK